MRPPCMSVGPQVESAPVFTLRRDLLWGCFYDARQLSESGWLGHHGACIRTDEATLMV